jgi:hypothetical protein
VLVARIVFTFLEDFFYMLVFGFNFTVGQYYEVTVQSKHYNSAVTLWLSWIQKLSEFQKESGFAKNTENHVQGWMVHDRKTLNYGDAYSH